MTDEEMINAAKQVDGLGGMTVNERLFASGLMDEFERASKVDKAKARRILELLQVDEPSIAQMIR